MGEMGEVGLRTGPFKSGDLYIVQSVNTTVYTLYTLFATFSLLFSVLFPFRSCHVTSSPSYTEYDMDRTWPKHE